MVMVLVLRAVAAVVMELLGEVVGTVRRAVFHTMFLPHLFCSVHPVERVEMTVVDSSASSVVVEEVQSVSVFPERSHRTERFVRMVRLEVPIFWVVMAIGIRAEVAQVVRSISPQRP
jgi:hypothetical protein